jgi:phage repressor protein C with HTH and peptisase S24 domain
MYDGERLKQLRADLRLTQAEMAEKLGTHVNTYGAYERGAQVPSSDVLLKLYEQFNVSSDWILYGLGDPTSQAQGKPAGEPVGGDQSYFGLVPMAEAHLDAGGGAVVMSEAVRDYFAFRKDWLRRVATAVRNLILMTVRGDSMEPLLVDGDVVMIDQGRRMLSSGQIYALGMEQAIMLKRLERLPGKRVRIISDNRIYPPYDVPEGDIRLLGQIVWFARQLVRPD